MAVKKGVKIWSAVSERTDALIDKFAIRRDVTKSSAVAELVEIGLAQQGSIETLIAYIEQNNTTLVQSICKEQQKQINKLQNQVDRIGKDLSILKKNERYGDQASLATFAWLCWYSQYFQYTLTGYDGTAVTERDETTYTRRAGRAMSMFDLGVSKTYALFWDVGGKLCRDPKEILHSFWRFGEIMNEQEMMDVLGKTDAEWKKRISYTDSDAISKLADKNNKKDRGKNAN